MYTHTRGIMLLQSLATAALFVCSHLYICTSRKPLEGLCLLRVRGPYGSIFAPFSHSLFDLNRLFGKRYSIHVPYACPQNSPPVTANLFSSLCLSKTPGRSCSDVILKWVPCGLQVTIGFRNYYYIIISKHCCTHKHTLYTKIGIAASVLFRVRTLPLPRLFML